MREPDRVVSWIPTSSMVRPDPFHVDAAGQHDTARQRRPDQLVAAHRDTVDAGVEPVGLGFGHEGQDHAAEGGVGVEVAVGHSQAAEDFLDTFNVVDGPAHGRADIGDDHRR